MWFHQPVDLVVSSIAGALCLLAFAAYAPLILGTLKTFRSFSLNLCLGSACALIVLWSMDINTGLGLSLHLIGIAAVVIMIGPELALLSGLLAALALMLVKPLELSVVPLSILVFVVLPVMVMHWLIHLEKKLSSRNFFVFIMLNGFVGGMLTISLVTLASVLVSLLAGASWTDNHSMLMMYIPLLAMPEGILNGMVVSGFMVYVPEWVRMLDERRYDRRYRSRNS